MLATSPSSAASAAAAPSTNRHAKERTRSIITSGSSVLTQILIAVLVTSVVLTVQTWSLHGRTAEAVVCEQQWFDDGRPTTVSSSSSSAAAASSASASSSATKVIDGDGRNNNNNNNNNNNENNNDTHTTSSPMMMMNSTRLTTTTTTQTIFSDNVVYFVFSRHDAFDLRQTIRETWAKGHDNVYFVLGRPCWIPPKHRGADLGGNEACVVAPKPIHKRFVRQAMKYRRDYILEQVEPKLRDERTTHKDIVMMEDHIYDSYGSLPEKLKAAYTFTHENLPPTVDFVVKVDDDFFVRIDEFSEHLNQNYRHLASVPALIGGEIRREHRAFTEGKWKELPQFREGAIYPRFAMGSFGHVVTRPIFEYVATHKEMLFNYQGEDASLGIWIKQSPRFLDNNDENVVKYIKSPVMAGDGNCLARDKYVVGHDVDKNKIIECHRVFETAS
jgi:hypothetical protein